MKVVILTVLKKCSKPNVSLYSPYYDEACNEFAVPNSASIGLFKFEHYSYYSTSL